MTKSVPRASKALRSDKKARRFTPQQKVHKLSPFHTFLSSKKIDGDKKTKVKSLVTLDERKISSPDTDSMPMYSSLVDPLAVYRFRLGGYTTANITSGSVDVFIASDPSPSGWASPEWASLASLFAEFKLVSLTIHIARNFIADPPNPSGKGNLAVASNLGLATNAGSYASIADNADVKWYSQWDTSVSGISHTMKSDQINWSETLTPTTQPYAGAPGCIQLFSQNGLTTSGGGLYQIIISGVYDFRVRT
jgi:hypothetical protein